MWYNHVDIFLLGATSDSSESKNHSDLALFNLFMLLHKFSFIVDQFLMIEGKVLFVNIWPSFLDMQECRNN